MSAPQWISEKIFDICRFPNGFYVECGANNGIAQSNTLRLEKELGWTGILIEASPTAYNECKNNRDNSKNVILNVALSSPDKEGTMIMGDFSGKLMGSVNGKRTGHAPTVQAKCTTFATVMRENKVQRVHLFSLDVEGHELNVLQGVDFQACVIDMIVVEVYDSEKEPIFKFLSEKGYTTIIDLSQFNKAEWPSWDGTHNDYLFRK